MDKPSIKLQPISSEDASQVPVRKSFRIPVSQDKSYRVWIRKVPYLLFDISETGIGLCSDTRIDFDTDDIISDCELELAGNRLTGFTGRMIHCNTDRSGHLHYGIAWMNLGDKEKKELETILTGIKETTLQNYDRALDEDEDKPL